MYNVAVAVHSFLIRPTFSIRGEAEATQRRSRSHCAKPGQLVMDALIARVYDVIGYECYHPAC